MGDAFELHSIGSACIPLTGTTYIQQLQYMSFEAAIFNHDKKIYEACNQHVDL